MCPHRIGERSERKNCYAQGYTGNAADVDRGLLCYAVQEGLDVITWVEASQC